MLSHFRTISCSGRKQSCVQENRCERFARETDINIIKQCKACVKDEVYCVKIICGDSDIFVLLTVYMLTEVLMEAFDSIRSLIDINEVAKKHAEIVHHSFAIMQFLVAILCESYMVLETRQS